MIDGRSSFDQPVKNNLRTYDNIRKIVTGQGDDYISVCVFTRLSLFQKILYINCNRFKETTNARC